MQIRQATSEDWSGIWRVIQPVFRAGTTYAVSRDISEQDARSLWLEDVQATFLMHDDKGHILGTYYLKQNQSGPGSHVCNCGYIVAKSAQGQGVATALCRHSQTHAASLGYRLMQYNLVAATNQRAVALWQKEGFQIAGTLPGAFHHPRHGYVDAYIMLKDLTGIGAPAP